MTPWDFPYYTNRDGTNLKGASLKDLSENPHTTETSTNTTESSINAFLYIFVLFCLNGFKHDLYDRRALIAREKNQA